MHTQVTFNKGLAEKSITLFNLKATDLSWTATILIDGVEPLSPLPWLALAAAGGGVPQISSGSIGLDLSALEVDGVSAIGDYHATISVQGTSSDVQTSSVTLRVLADVVSVAASGFHWAAETLRVPSATLIVDTKDAYGHPTVLGLNDVDDFALSWEHVPAPLAPHTVLSHPPISYRSLRSVLLTAPRPFSGWTPLIRAPRRRRRAMARWASTSP